MSQPSEKIVDELAEKTQATILCVDDEANILSALRRLLRTQGHKLLFAESGVQGLAVMEKEAVDLVISDMRMPEMDGATFLTEVAQRWPDTMRILLTGYSDMSATVDAINKGKIFKYISKPWEDNDIILSIQRALDLKNLERERHRLEVLTNKQNEELQDLNKNLELKVKQRTTEIEQTLGMYESANDELKQTYSATVEVFANLVAMRRGYAGGDIRRVSETARIIASELGMNDSQAEDVYYAGLLRDIGLIGLPDTLINRPLDSLSDVERNHVLEQSVIGQGVLMALDALQGVALIIRCQNERLDGQGYPDHLKGSEIPLGARILKVLNDYYGLQNGSLSEEQHSPASAKEYLLQHRGTIYDPDVTDLLFRVVDHIEDCVEQEEVRIVKSNGLAPGMVLARDVVSPSGVLLLSKGHVVSEALIARISTFEKSIETDLDISIIGNQET